MHDEHLLWDAASLSGVGYDEMTPGTLIDRGEEFIHRSFGGEAIC